MSIDSALGLTWLHPPAWQPIETAPLDRTRVLVCENETVVLLGEFDKYWKECGYGWRIFPTHWMPLPEPPK